MELNRRGERAAMQPNLCGGVVAPGNVAFVHLAVVQKELLVPYGTSQAITLCSRRRGMQVGEWVRSAITQQAVQHR